MKLNLIKCILMLVLLSVYSCDKDEMIEEVQDNESPVLGAFRINNQLYTEDSITLSRNAEFTLKVNYSDESIINNRSIKLVINDDPNLTRDLIQNQTNVNFFSYGYHVLDLVSFIFDDPDNPYITSVDDVIKFNLTVKDEFDNESQKTFTVNLSE